MCVNASIANIKYLLLRLLLSMHNKAQDVSFQYTNCASWWESGAHSNNKAFSFCTWPQNKKWVGLGIVYYVCISKWWMWSTGPLPWVWTVPWLFPPFPSVLVSRIATVQSLWVSCRVSTLVLKVPSFFCWRVTFSSGVGLCFFLRWFWLMLLFFNFFRRG